MAIVGAAAIIGTLIWAVVSHPSLVLILAAGLDGVMVLQAAHKLILNLGSKQPQSAEELVGRLGLIGQLIVALAVALAAVGEARGWVHGGSGIAGHAALGVAVIYLIGAPIYWLGGKRRLVAALKARGIGGTPPPGPAPAS